MFITGVKYANQWKKEQSNVPQEIFLYQNDIFAENVETSNIGMLLCKYEYDCFIDHWLFNIMSIRL